MTAITEIQREIHNGRLTLRPDEYQRRARVFGATRVVPQGRTPADRIARAGAGRGATTLTRSPASVTTQVGEAPEGFGKYVQWAQEDTELAVVVFLNAADPLGVAILGVTPGDTFGLEFAAGLASFAEDTENEGVSSIIGIVAAGATMGASAFGVPEAGPLIAEGASFAQDKYKERQVRTKVRDAYGEDPSSRRKARQEGGVLVCKPEAHGTYYSGHDERFWIRFPGDRIDRNRPEHLGRNAFFIRRGMGPQRVREAGDLCLLAWDHVFPDNFGFYELHVIMRRGDLPPTPVDPDPVD
jgi:hypothetical protein